MNFFLLSVVSTSNGGLQYKSDLWQKGKRARFSCQHSKYTSHCVYDLHCEQAFHRFLETSCMHIFLFHLRDDELVSVYTQAAPYKSHLFIKCPSLQLSQLSLVPKQTRFLHHLTDSLGGNIHTNAQISANTHRERCKNGCWALEFIFYSIFSLVVVGCTTVSEMQKSGVCLGVSGSVCTMYVCEWVRWKSLCWAKINLCLAFPESATLYTHISTAPPFDHSFQLSRRRRRVFFVLNAYHTIKLAIPTDLPQSQSATPPRWIPKMK